MIERLPFIVSTWRRVMPVSWRRRLHARFGHRWFRGPYATWAEAQSVATGYNDAAIVNRVLHATQEVCAGRAAFERDGVTFPDPAPDAPLLAAFQRLRATIGAGLRVLDFGGALGSIYWRHRPWLAADDVRCWDIVEQPSFVAAGRAHLGNTPLRFFATLDEACAVQSYDVLLASGVIQYLERPGDHLAHWRRLPVPWLVLNNVPLHDGAPDRLLVQHVPPSLYPASYPVWTFNREAFLASLRGNYELVETFAAEAVWPIDRKLYPSTGLTFRRILSP